MGNPDVFIYNDYSVTTSLNIAECFGIGHLRVLDDIYEICGDCPAEIFRAAFAPCEYVDTQGHRQTAYLISFDGFILLTLGYVGANALDIQRAYISLFSSMRREMESRQRCQIFSEEDTLNLLACIAEKNFEAEEIRRFADSLDRYKEKRKLPC